MKLLLIVLILLACNPVKKSLKVARQNPNEFSGFCAEIFPVGELITVKDSTRFDTLYQESEPVIHTDIVRDTVFKTVFFPGSTRLITKTVTKDSLIIRRDKAAEKALEFQRDNLIVNNKDVISQRDGFKKGRNWWRIACLITWGILGIGLVWKLFVGKYLNFLK